MSEIGLVAPRVASARVYSGSEVRRLVCYADSLGYDLAANVVTNRDDSVKYEAAKLRLYRLFVRLMMHTDRVLSELPVESGAGGPWTIRQRELFYYLLGNHSRRVVSMSDDELFVELFEQLRDYH